jgi:hypothetical protein
MLSQLQRSARRSIMLIFIALTVSFPVRATAQEQPSLLGNAFKRVILDPTTYVPASLTYDATVRDWNSSQPFFQNGYFEHNERFTVSGLPNDRAMSYAEGRRQILSDALINLELSIANNMADQLFERLLLRRFPDHRKLVRAMGWIERISFASTMSYRLAAPHYRQAAENVERARQMGFK